MVVSNRSCPVDIQEQLKEAGKHLVSTEWIVQCLINGTRCPLDCTVSYKSDQMSPHMTSLPHGIGC